MLLVSQIKEYPDYVITSGGEVISFRRYSDGRTMKPDTVQGYKAVGIINSTGRKAQKIHRLVAQAFIPNLCNKAQVNHKDGDKANNNLWNLEWATPRENQLHAIAYGLTSVGEDHSNSKLKESQVVEIFHSPEEHHALAKEFNISKSSITAIKTGLTWGHLTGKVYQKANRGNQPIKLTKDQVLHIYESRDTNLKLATLFNISKSSVYKIKAGGFSQLLQG